MSWSIPLWAHTDLEPTQRVAYVQFGTNCGLPECAWCGEPVWRDSVRAQWTGLAVEAVPPLYERMRANYAAHNAHVHALNYALALADGPVSFFVNRARHSLSHLASRTAADAAAASLLPCCCPTAALLPHERPGALSGASLSPTSACECCRARSDASQRHRLHRVRVGVARRAQSQADHPAEENARAHAGERSPRYPHHTLTTSPNLPSTPT